MGKTKKDVKRAIKRSRGGLGPDKYLTKSQQNKLLSYVKAQADLGRARGSKRAVIDEMICLFLVQAGLRASEVCNLKLKDLPVHHGKNCIWIENSKGKVSRTVAIPEKLSKVVKRFCRLYRKEAKPGDYLFISSRGKKLCYMTLYQKIRRLGRKSGMGKLHPHMLRHTFATRLYSVERDLLFVSDQLGHANVSTTQIYARTDNQARKDQIEKMYKINFGSL